MEEVAKWLAIWLVGGFGFGLGLWFGIYVGGIIYNWLDNVGDRQ